MKKIIAVVFALAILFAFAAAAESFELTPDKTTGTMDVSLTVDTTLNQFTVVIPSSVAIDPVKKESIVSITLKAGWEIPASNGIDVWLTTTANGYSKGTSLARFWLKSGSDIHGYYMQVKRSGESSYEDVNNPQYGSGYTDANMPFIKVKRDSDKTKDATASLRIYVSSLPAAGVWTDTLTFAIELK